jgi:hypothetical protein
MSAYLQMGHDSENLVGEKDLDDFRGIILSPVNRTPDELRSDVAAFRKKATYDILLDPQMYVPKCDRGVLKKHPYFGDDIDSVALSDEKWWTKTAGRIAKYGVSLGVDGIVSPVVHPKVWSDEYYSLTVRSADHLAAACAASGIRASLTLMVSLDALEKVDTAMRIASIASSSRAEGVYLVVVTDVPPRQELADAEALLALLSLVRSLREAGKTIIVSHCSSDMLLYKAAGATHCATGKFFNLRRYARSRYEEPAQGGGQLAYWFEHSLVAFLRQTDIARLQKKALGHLLCQEASRNHWAMTILDQLANAPKEPWVRFGWRQYLSWFAKTETRLSSSDGADLVSHWLKTAEKNWRQIEDEAALLTEPRNDGSWIRPWRQALSDLESA